MAFTVGSVFRLPCQVYTQRILQRRTELSLLLQAWNSRLQHDVAHEDVPQKETFFEVKNRQEAILRRVYRKLRLQEWRLYSSVASFPFWLLAIDSVRCLCGGQGGLLGLFMAGFGEDMTDAAGLIPSSEVPTEGLSSAVEATADTATAVMDPSLAIEGCLWFTDLTVADPVPHSADAVVRDISAQSPPQVRGDILRPDTRGIRSAPQECTGPDPGWG